MRAAAGGMLIAVVLSATTVANAQTPAPAQDARALYAGTWTGSMTDKTSQSGTAGTTTNQTTCSWQGGAVYLVCELHYDTGKTSGEQLTVYTRSADGKYEFSRLGAQGGSFDMEVAATANSWTYSTQYNDSGTPVQLRVVNTFPNPNEYAVRVESSRDGGRSWTVQSQGIQRRSPAP